MHAQRPPAIASRVALHLRDSGDATVNGLARTLQVSRTSVENVLRGLIDSGTVIRTTVSGAGVGRPSRSYEFNAGSGFVAGVDVGNSSTRVLISDLAGIVLAHHTGAGIGGHADGASKLGAVLEAVREAFRSAGLPLGKLRALGLSLPGIVNESGLVLNSVVIPEWSGVDIGSRFRDVLGVPIAVDNGVRLAAVAEHHLGAAQLVSDMLYLSVGNRVAMGLIIDGKPRRGTHDLAGDVGRLVVPGSDTATGQISWDAGADAAEVFALARGGNAAAAKEIESFVDRLARALSMLIMAVDPAKVVIGGGLSRAHEEFLTPLASAVSRHLQIPFEIPIVEARFGDEAAAYGALVLAFRREAENIYGLGGMTVPSISPHDPSAGETLNTAVLD